MVYQVAERFKSIQGEGVYAGTPMAFIRFVGCSVGKKICQHCDTIFEHQIPWQGGGEYTEQELLDWAAPYEHICLTGGEPLDQDLEPLIKADMYRKHVFHLETSGTQIVPEYIREKTHEWYRKAWVCISPKPGFIEEQIILADEIKVIVQGLGTPQSLKMVAQYSPDDARGHQHSKRDTFRWPTLEDALRWAHMGKVVFLQPRNEKFNVDMNNLRLTQDIIAEHPNLRLSVQMHKILKVQ